MDTVTHPPLTATFGTHGATASKTILAFLLAPFLAPLLRRIAQLLFRLEHMMALWKAGELPLPAPRASSPLPPPRSPQRRHTPALRRARAPARVVAACPAQIQILAPRSAAIGHQPRPTRPALAPPRAIHAAPPRRISLDRVANLRSFCYDIVIK